MQIIQELSNKKDIKYFLYFQFYSILLQVFYLIKLIKIEIFFNKILKSKHGYSLLF